MFPFFLLLSKRKFPSENFGTKKESCIINENLVHQLSSKIILNSVYLDRSGVSSLMRVEFSTTNLQRILSALFEVIVIPVNNKLRSELQLMTSLKHIDDCSSLNRQVVGMQVIEEYLVGGSVSLAH